MATYKISLRDAPEGFGWSWVRAINNAGQMCGVGTYPADGAAARPIAWFGAGAGQQIAVPGEEGAAYDINDAGDVVGYMGSYAPDHSAFVYRNGTTAPLAGVPGPWSIALSINNSGLIAGTCGPTLGTRVFVHDSNQDVLVETIEPLPGHDVTRDGYVNDEGHVVGISSYANGLDARLFIRRNGSTEELGPVTYVRGINASDMVVGTRAAVGLGAFRCLTSGSNPIFEQCGPGAEGRGINKTGLVVGFYLLPVRGGGVGEYDLRPFVHYPAGHPGAGFQDLPSAIENLAGWYSLVEAVDVNDKGYIAGQGILDSGAVSVFVLEPQPEKPNLTDHHLLQFLKFLGAVVQGGGGTGIIPGGPPVPIPPHGFRPLLPAQRDLAVGQLASLLSALVGNRTLGADMDRLGRELMAAAARELDTR